MLPVRAQRIKACKAVMEPSFRITEISSGDNKALAKIIRDALSEHHAAKPGTVFYDESTDHLSDLFATPRSAYFVVRLQDDVAGGAGIFPTEGLGPDTCELVKMYLAPGFRARGFAWQLMERCIAKAQELGYKRIYIETMPELKAAIAFYQKAGFNFLPRPLGNSGHTGCDVWMVKEI